MRSIVVFLLLLTATAAPAQTSQVGRVAGSANGQAGQRQTPDQAAAEGIAVIGRVDGRIQNRVQSRIRNRIDRYYSPQANADAPFTVASDQARAASRPRRR